MYNYYDIIAKYGKQSEVLYGSYVRSDCVHELEAEKESWLNLSYTGIKIVKRQVHAEPDQAVYKDDLEEIAEGNEREAIEEGNRLTRETHERANVHAAKDKAFTDIMQEFQTTNDNYQCGDTSLEGAVKQVESLCKQFDELFLHEGLQEWN